MFCPVLAAAVETTSTGYSRRKEGKKKSYMMPRLLHLRTASLDDEDDTVH